MTTDEFKKQLEAIDNMQLAEMAHKELSKLCQTGGDSFRMTVPPKVTDTDMLFSEIITRFEKLHLESIKPKRTRLTTGITVTQGTWRID